MYLQHFSLNKKPFSINPDPSFLYLAKKHAQAFAMLQYGIKEQMGFAVVTGEVGAGKTTLLRKVLEELDSNDNIGLVSHTHPNLESVIPTVLDAFGVVADDIPDESFAQYRFFVDFLLGQYRKGRRCILLIDEAQNLSLQALEQLRLLSNVNADGHMLLQTVLVGQPELREKLSRPELLQFAQRISVDYFLPHLSFKEACAYIDHRLQVAGGDPSIFESKSKALLAVISKGIPRTINNLCDMALVYAFGEGLEHVPPSIVLDVIKDKEESNILPIVKLDELREKVLKAC